MLQHYINLIMHELNRAEIKHPDWPADAIHAAAVLGEESGELLQAAIDFHYEGGDINRSRMHDEAIQTAAMALRFLCNLQGYNPAIPDQD